MKTRLWSWLATGRRVFPLRPAGLALVVLSLFVVLRYSRDEADYLLNPAGLVVLALVLACTALVLVGALSLRRAVRALPPGLPENLETTHLASTSFRVPALKAWVVLDVRVDWLFPTGVAVGLEPAGGFLEELVTPTERGRFTHLTRRFTVEDVFGLAAVSFTWTWDTPLRIAPVAAPCSPAIAASRATGDAWSHPSGRPEGDLVEMRSYAHGDSMRHVLWKTFARTRRLLVRMPERAVTPHPVSVAFLVAGPGDEPTAGVARVFVEQGLLGSDFLFSADGALQPTGSVAEAVEQIVDSAAARDRGGALDDLAGQIDRARLAACLIFAPPVDGPWRGRLTSMLTRHGLSGTVIIGVDGATRFEAAPSALRRFLLEPDDEPLPGTAAGLPALREALESSGLKVQVVHRGTGQVM